MSHTPGPWQYEYREDWDCPSSYEIWDKADRLGCRTHRTEEIARLIAAAPDLLEALQGLLNVVQRTPAAQDGFNLISISRARDAIRTALGDDEAA